MISSVFGIFTLLRPRPIVLNHLQPTTASTSPGTTSDDPVHIVNELRMSMLQLKGKFMDDKGERVNYASMRDSLEFRRYQELARKLPSIQLDDLSLSARKALFINTYNCLILHGLVANQLTSYDTISRLTFYATTSYSIGGHILSLNDIENGLLRGNRRSPVPLSSLPFKSNDPRLKYALPCDPRIHFALNCAAKSCPPIAVYSSNDSELEDQLNLATGAFLENSLEIDTPNKCVTLSMLFKWYAKDFGDNDHQRLEWIASHCIPEQASKLRAFLNSCPNFNIRYSPYSWDLNE